MVNTIVAPPAVLHSALEVWFIQNCVFGGVSITLDLHANQIRGKTVVYLDYDLNPATIDLLSTNDNRIIVYHLGDETAIKDRNSYSSVDMVLRNYYFEHIINEQNPNVHWVPNGYRSGLGPRDSESLKPTNQRPMLASFLGWTANTKSFNNERFDFGKAAKLCGQDLYMNETSGFAQGFNISLYAAVLENSVFCPCPAGNSPETIRLYDALEAGAIPIMLDHRFLQNANPHQAPPFPILGSWAELPHFLADARSKMNAQPRYYSDMQYATSTWWKTLKDRSRRRVIEHTASP